jgi:hypothetical protein
VEYEIGKRLCKSLRVRIAAIFCDQVAGSALRAPDLRVGDALSSGHQDIPNKVAVLVQEHLVGTGGCEIIAEGDCGVGKGVMSVSLEAAIDVGSVVHALGLALV